MAESSENVDKGSVTVSTDSDQHLIEHVDRKGNIVKQQIVEGVYMHIYYTPSVVRQIPDVQMMYDDVYLCSFPRTGQHWTFEMTSMLLNGNTETIKKYKGKHQLDFVPCDELKLIPSPRVLTVHNPFSRAPRDLGDKKCKVIYLIRDPRDVAVSLYHVYCDWGIYVGEEKSFENFLHLFIHGKVDVNGIFSHFRDAELYFKENPDISAHVMAYEDTFQNPVATVQTLSDYLGVTRNNELCKAIADKCAFSNMVEDKKPYARIVDGKSILYRQGTAGDWRNYFTEEMLEDYYRVYEEKMAGSRFYQRYAREKK